MWGIVPLIFNMVKTKSKADKFQSKSSMQLMEMRIRLNKTIGTELSQEGVVKIIEDAKLFSQMKLQEFIEILKGELITGLSLPPLYRESIFDLIDKLEKRCLGK